MIENLLDAFYAVWSLLLLMVMGVLVTSLYVIPWSTVVFCVINLAKYSSVRDKYRAAPDTVSPKELKKRKTVLVISTVVMVVMMILYFTVIIKFGSEISFM